MTRITHAVLTVAALSVQTVGRNLAMRGCLHTQTNHEKKQYKKQSVETQRRQKKQVDGVRGLLHGFLHQVKTPPKTKQKKQAELLDG